MRTTTEWSVEFDLLYNNIMSNQAPGLNEYEKSVFLTRAQENVVLQLYNGSARESFEESEELTRYLASLVIQGVGNLDTESSTVHIVPESYIFKLPDDILFRTYDYCIVYKNSEHTSEFDIPVVPVTQDYFWRTRRNPFKREGKTRILRLTFSENEEMSEGIVEHEYSELISNYEIKEYHVRYLKKPLPIILTDLTETGLSIDGEVLPKTCLLPEVLHNTILTEAVSLAKAVWNSNN